MFQATVTDTLIRSNGTRFQQQEFFWGDTAAEALAEAEANHCQTSRAVITVEAL